MSKMKHFLFFVLSILNWLHSIPNVTVAPSTYLTIPSDLVTEPLF